MKVKVFSAKGNQIFNESTYFKKSTLTSQIEQDINHWLENNPKINITNIKQSSCGGSFDVEKHFISVWYEED